MWFEGLRLKKSNNLNPSYICSVCNIMLCGECDSKLRENLKIGEKYQCSHCRNYDYKDFMLNSVLKSQLMQKVMGKEKFEESFMERIEELMRAEDYI
jgi:hypothetical protein